ncbi:hypothetical protein G6F61_010841 [Rhizopus arrhizus]|jgi:pSer/pThr/pTyr-binding forkhead associated (FHA) protein|nr:hypothetical protein G6F32_011064 [Rhizopus arrhizus]KAG1134966.1 hypothetical protein G6F42_000045 [Rhizopus arrhizus]KAG1283600.1 hypothetical protein G6F66_010878 [Rhizopus arrhizus]KAG1372677.1 hypothetical protein G6F61_010841 [Rhizopus arrhizus]
METNQEEENKESTPKEKEQWIFDDFFGIYVMHGEKRVMYHNGEQWICGDYDSFYTTAATTNNSTHSIRLVVQSCPFFKPGQVVLVDENGLTVGRDRSWDRRLRLPEMAVSKYHCMVFLNPTTQQFYIVDVGSQHGTIVNGKRLSKTKQSSLPQLLHHLDSIEIGSTTLQVHLHQTGPCKECLTQVFIDVSSGKKEKRKPSGMQDLATNKRDWMRYYKECYDLGSTQQVNDEYVDRAELRRQTTVDATPIPKPQIATPPVSVSSPVPHLPVSSSPQTAVKGIGSDMLKKLGWQEGQSLGKNQTGITEPIQLATQKDRAGLGMKK